MASWILNLKVLNRGRYPALPYVQLIQRKVCSAAQHIHTKVHFKDWSICSVPMYATLSAPLPSHLFAFFPECIYRFFKDMGSIVYYELECSNAFRNKYGTENSNLNLTWTTWWSGEPLCQKRTNITRANKILFWFCPRHKHSLWIPATTYRDQEKLVAM